MGGNKVYLAKYKTTKAWFPLNKIKYIYKTITLTGGVRSGGAGGGVFVLNQQKKGLGGEGTPSKP